jgi:hypothetical protein
MAVRAAHFALVDFGSDACPTATAPRVDRYVCNLVADVIELENDNVALTAVDAWMLAEILDDLLAHLRASLGDVFVDTRLLPLMVLPIIPRVGLSEALATPRLQFRLAPSHWRKRFERLHFATFRARSHEGERAVASLSLK